MTVTAPTNHPPLTLRRIARTWWPLAVSWLLMTSELPLMSAVIARLPDSEINLAAWGVVFALSTIIQAPSVMLLAASTALSKDWDSYVKLRRFMLVIGVSTTAIHILIAFTPLYYLVMGRLIGAPVEIIEPVRLGLMIMVPWSWGTGYRRFEQGVLIRFDCARAVVWGSLLRLGMDSLVLTVGYLSGVVPGLIVATSATIIGIISEALYAGLRVRPILRHQLRQAPSTDPPLTLPALLNFYTPLAVTVLLIFLVHPMVSAALSRMPNALESLAVWPVLFGLLNMWQSAGIAHNETVIALLDESQAVRGLRRFTVLLVLSTTVLLLIMAATPLVTFWFSQVAGLTPSLVALARQGLWLAVLLPGLRALQSWYQGVITYSRRTRGITESVVVFLLTSGAILGAGVAWGQITGLYVGMVAFVAGFFMQTVWLWQRSRRTIQAVHIRDTAGTVLHPAKASA